MRSRVISTCADLQALLAKDLGPGAWSQISEEQARRFEAARRAGPHDTGRRCSKSRPALVDGALLLSLLGRLRASIEDLRFEFPSRMNLLYGFDDVRFSDPVPAPVMIRLFLRIVDVKLLEPGTIHVVYAHRLETSEGLTILEANAINRIYLQEQAV